jgi:hypothetical protein
VQSESTWEKTRKCCRCYRLVEKRSHVNPTKWGSTFLCVSLPVTNFWCVLLKVLFQVILSSLYTHKLIGTQFSQKLRWWSWKPSIVKPLCGFRNCTKEPLFYNRSSITYRISVSQPMCRGTLEFFWLASVPRAKKGWETLL